MQQKTTLNLDKKIFSQFYKKDRALYRNLKLQVISSSKDFLDNEDAKKSKVKELCKTLNTTLELKENKSLPPETCTSKVMIEARKDKLPPLFIDFITTRHRTIAAP